MEENRHKKNLFRYLKQVKDRDEPLIEDFSDLLKDGLGLAPIEQKKEIKFLNRFDARDISKLLEQSGLTESLKNSGFNKLYIEINRDQANVHCLKIYNNILNPENLLIDVRVSESRFAPEDRFFNEKDISRIYDLFVIEWLSSEHPGAIFSEQRPQLPGQRTPGLGALKYLIDILHMVAKTVLKDGFVDVPDHIHGAIMYSKFFKFFNPASEAVLQAVLRDLKGYSLNEISWGEITNTILEKDTGSGLLYEPSEQIFPVSLNMKKYFNSKKYKEEYNKVYNRKHYCLDYKKMLEAKEELLRCRSIADL